MVSPAQRKIKRWLNQPEGDYGSRDGFQKGWCPRPDSNRHGLPHTPLKRARLPIPPLGLKEPALTGRPGGTPADRRILPRSQCGVLAGAAGAGAAGFAGAGAAGLAGAVFVAAAFALPCPAITVPPTPPLKRAIETVVRMKMTNEATVSLCNSVVAPRPP